MLDPMLKEALKFHLVTIQQHEKAVKEFEEASHNLNDAKAQEEASEAHVIKLADVKYGEVRNIVVDGMLYRFYFTSYHTGQSLEHGPVEM